MDSINAQQPEKNHEDVNSNAAVKRIKATVKKADTCFLHRGEHVWRLRRHPTDERAGRR